MNRGFVAVVVFLCFLMFFNFLTLGFVGKNYVHYGKDFFLGPGEYEIVLPKESTICITSESPFAIRFADGKIRNSSIPDGKGGEKLQTILPEGVYSLEGEFHISSSEFIFAKMKEIELEFLTSFLNAGIIGILAYAIHCWIDSWLER